MMFPDYAPARSRMALDAIAGRSVPSVASTMPAMPPTMHRPRLGMFGRGPSLNPMEPVDTAPVDNQTAIAAPSIGGMFGASAPAQPRPRMSSGRMIAGHMGDALMAMNGLRPIFAPMLEGQRQADAQAAQADQEWQRRMAMAQWQAELDRTAPRYFNSGNDRIAFDPASGEARVVYDGMSDAQDYAASLGLTPGTDEFTTALQDYVLRHSGPTALENDIALEGTRQGNRVALEGLRQGNRVALRQSPTYAQSHPRQPAPRASAPRGGSGRSSGGAAASGRPTAVAADGRRVHWNGRAWVPDR